MMEKELFFVLVVVCILTHCLRSVYELLKHRKLLQPNRLTFAVVFTDMALLWTSWFCLCRLDLGRINMAPVLQYFGILLVVTGILIFFSALFTIKTLESYDGNLITTGIYSKIRHPMYLGFILWLIGFPVVYGALFSFILSFLFIANILLWRYLEEIELEERFPSYPDYKKTTLF
ncbi:MAG TPA: isoprenylcysteine carboxylmethyltransferase family protein [Prolixibacteraceae bacterium]|jgi:protein-S-isoprenylcysteine O-methyltransferase Ste14